MPFGDRLWLWADPSDIIEREVFLTGGYDGPTAKFMASLLRPGDVYVDVGAHVGCHVLHAAALVGPAGEVVAVEPNPSSVARLRRNLALNDLHDRVRVIERAASDRRGDAALFFSDDPNNSGGASLGGQASPTSSIAVQCDTLDTLIPDDLVRRTALIKLDVEGHEPRALAGASRLLDRSPAVIFECNGEETCELLLAAGFALHALEADGGLRPIPRAGVSGLVQPGQGRNVLALVPGSAVADRIALH